MTEVHEILIRARSLIADIDHWCQEHYAIDNRGHVCTPQDPAANRWCARGVVQHVEASGSARDIALSKLDEAAKELFPFLSSSVHPVALVNDGSEHPSECHAMILTIYDRAIANIARLNTDGE